VALAAVSTASLRAQNYSEVGDAGQTLGTAQNTGVPGTSLTSITGSLSSGTDADVFRFNITAPSTFSASTVNVLTTMDTALFLFNSSGLAIYTNDDASGSSVQSGLPAGSAFTLSLAPGTYYIAISLSGNEPINLNSQLLFAGYPSGDSTAVRGPAGGVSPASLFNFNGQTFSPETGTYQITLTSSAAVPEPSTMALALAGAAGLAFWLRRRLARASA
jgi:hypothetical protein